MTSTTRSLARFTALGLAVLATATGCSSSGSSDSTSAAVTTPASVSAAPPTSAQASSSTPPSAASRAAAASGPLAGPCDLLTKEQISAASSITVADGAESIDTARQVQMCTWKSDDPFLIVAASLTDVAAEEAFKTNVDLAPAYFDGEAVTITVPGADKAYAVQQPDVGWVVGAIAKGRFVQVQVGGNDVTQEQAAALVADAIARMPS